MLDLRNKIEELKFCSGLGVTDDLCVHVSRLKATVKARLDKFRGKRNLLTYDGSIFDQLAYRIISQCWRPEQYSVLCAVRPCMDERLRINVRSFAKENGFPLIDTDGDCIIDYQTLHIKEHKCSNVSSAISEFFKAEGGTQISASIIDDVERRHGERFFEDYPGISSHVEDEGTLLWSHSYDGKPTWKTMFLFHNFLPYEILACYLVMTDELPQPWQIPCCYVPCYYETHKARVLTLINRSQHEIKARLSAVPELLKAVRASVHPL